MKIALTVVGIMLTLMGVTWFFQGINLLPGSFMTGQIQWAYYGGLAALAGVGTIVAANRRRRIVLPPGSGNATDVRRAERR
jgi:hypothetical protein